MAPLNGPYLLLCEGGSDAALFRELLQSRGRADIQVRSVKDGAQGIAGNTGFSDALRRARIADPSHVVDAIVLATDCDTQRQANFESVVGQIAAANVRPGQSGRTYPIPTAPNTMTDGSPRIAVLMIPTDQNAGAIESVVYGVAGQVNGANYVEVEGLAGRVGADQWPQQKQDKMKLRVFFSCTHAQNPEVSLGSVWQNNNSKYLVPLNHAAFNHLFDMIDSLFQP